MNALGRILCLLVVLISVGSAEEFFGPGQVTVPDLGVRVEVPSGWSLRYQGEGKVQAFFLNALSGSIRTFRFSETRREGSLIDVAMSEYRRVKSVDAGNRDVVYTIESRGEINSWYYLHYTINHPRLGESKGLVACVSRGNGRYLVAVGEGTQARVGKRQGLQPTDVEMNAMRKLLGGIQL